MRALRIALAAALAVLLLITVLVAVVILAPFGGGGAPEVLASDQTLSFPIAQDVADLDPAQISSPADVDILRNVFSGLYKFDEKLQEVPDLAIGSPLISLNRLTYTFQIRHDAKFSNGDPITADDFVYSWNRAASKQGDYASLFQPIVGYQAVADGRSKSMSGLVKLDAYSFTTTLTKPAGYWLTTVALWPFWIVDSKVIATAGDNVWFTNPQTLIGSGPFRMTSRSAGQALDFEPVPQWYGGSTGRITHVHIDVVADQSVQISRYESGVYSLIGYARQGLPPTAAVQYTTDPKLRSQLQLIPAGLTFWAAFNMSKGPFAGLATGLAGRQAFSIAIDRNALAAAVCNQGTACVPATGGLVSKGLVGFLGDGADPNAKFDPVAAKAEYKKWDPTGAKVRGLTYTYDTDPFNKAVCVNLAAQWFKNLGVTVKCVEVDRLTFFNQRNGKCAYPLFRQSWSADYDNPQDWFDYLFVAINSGGSCYSNPIFDTAVRAADQKPLGTAVADYKAAGQTLMGHIVFANLVYGVQQYLAHPWVKGVGGNALYDFSWTDARILKH
ncbi:MAG TPA: peptide ABC transporter substrate-binding protein [Candidatus Acidoferrum sp.]|jgi:oligopeptide transport system substrate-binding protein|nr:peptide ABC transporter substrate-binding protein [Candidatus Acidoferrum sp.]